MPSTRVWNSGGAPKMSLLAMVAPPAAGADDDGVAAAALVAAAGADVVAAVAGVDAAAGGVLLAVAGVFFELLHAVAPRTSAKPVLAMRIALRFMSLLVRQEKGRAVEQSSSRAVVRVGQEAATSTSTGAPRGTSAAATGPAAVATLVVKRPVIPRETTLRCTSASTPSVMSARAATSTPPPIICGKSCWASPS